MTAPAEDPRGGEGHNHVTRDIKPVGTCPACDEYWGTNWGIPRLPAAGRGDTDNGGESLPDAVLVEGDWVSPSYEAHARDLTKSWADAAQNSGCPAAFVARMRSFADVHDRNHRAALAARPAGDRAQPTQELREAIADELARHSDTMSRTWSDNDAEPVTVDLGCRCGHSRGTVTAKQMAADLPGFLRVHREHVASELLAGPLAALLDAQAAVSRVRELHAPLDRGTGPHCQGCATHVTFTPWPCKTIRALDGTT